MVYMWHKESIIFKVKKESKVKKRLTLPEKMRLKSKRLYKHRMSFVKKPKRRMLRD